ncbi:MAG TPA: hypothetical protein DE312_02480 [Gallionella sp.]|nr:hypothetical protein [Gallionella sp.]OGS67375.1 MAG: hypothetical protein A2Z87_04150 [Gallionellales bacterium GWA2_54_124]HCI52192.1 hypothetical protein [Gallionella sp.]
MPNATFMPQTETGKLELLEHLAATFSKYQSTFEISDADMQTLKSDAVNLRLAHTLKHQAQSYGHQCTAYMHLLWDGGNGDTSWPIAPVIVPSPAQIVTPGATARLSSLVARIKAHKNYTTAIGQDLHIIGAAIVLDTASLKPALSVKFNAGHPVIAWTKGKASAIEIHVDRGDGNGFTFFTINTEPDTIDDNPLPAAGAGVNWQYKAIYRLHDAQVGQWSDVVSIKAVSS